MDDRTQRLIEDIQLAADQLRQGTLDADGALERLRAIQEDYQE